MDVDLASSDEDGASDDDDDVPTMDRVKLPAVRPKTQAERNKITRARDRAEKLKRHRMRKQLNVQVDGVGALN